jgi:hypothetical protein
VRLLSIRNILFFAVLVGLITGISLAFSQDRASTNTSSSITAESASGGIDAAHILEMHGEEALIESDLRGLESLHKGFSTAPEFLRSELENRGIYPPEGATTEQLQELLAEAGVTMQEMHQ